MQPARGRIGSAVVGYVAGALAAGDDRRRDRLHRAVDPRRALRAAAGADRLPARPVPLVGATLGAIIVGLVTLFNDFPTDTIIWVVWSIIYQQVENTVIQPRIQARAVKVHPFVVLIVACCSAARCSACSAPCWRSRSRRRSRSDPRVRRVPRHARLAGPADDGPTPPKAAGVASARAEPRRASLAAAAGEQAGHRGDAAAEHEARDGGADDDLLAGGARAARASRWPW